MKVKVTSNVHGKTQLTGDYEIEGAMSIVEFMNSLKMEWDYDALVVVNDEIIGDDYIIKDGDHIYFLTPIYGG